MLRRTLISQGIAYLLVVTKVSKRVVLLLIAMLATSSLILVGSASAQSITKPSVPEFTLKYVDHSYDMPPTYSIDPYTGQNITHPGYHVENKTIDIIIKNQPFTSSMDGATYQLYYNVRQKGSYEENWTEGRWTDSGPGSLVPQSNSQSTVISIPVHSYPINASLDFQIQAVIGGYYQHIPPSPLVPAVTYFGVLASGESKWSSTQTIIIPDFTKSTSSPTSTLDQTTEPEANDSSQTLLLGIIIGTILTSVLISVGLLLYFKRIRKKV